MTSSLAFVAIVATGGWTGLLLMVLVAKARVAKIAEAISDAGVKGSEVDPMACVVILLSMVMVG